MIQSNYFIHLQGSRRSVGFTLIELLIVVAIIAILAAIAVPNFLEAQARAKVSRAKADMRSTATALESYAVDFTRYPLGAANGLTINPRILRYVPLTTPVAYIASVPNDVFNIEPLMENRQFIYQDRESYLAPLPGGNRYSGANASIRFLYDHFFFIQAPSASWILRSRGPSLEPINTAAPPKFDLNDVYDPTNGTISVGNVVRTGPGGATFGD